jgi:Leucine-rich repeat (LRR) protein
MLNINDFNNWNEEWRPIDENIIELNISHLYFESLGNLDNLVNLKILFCQNNQLTSLEGIENLVNLKILFC